MPPSPLPTVSLPFYDTPFIKLISIPTIIFFSPDLFSPQSNFTYTNNFLRGPGLPRPLRGCNYAYVIPPQVLIFKWLNADEAPASSLKIYVHVFLFLTNFHPLSSALFPTSPPPPLSSSRRPSFSRVFLTSPHSHTRSTGGGWLTFS